MRFIKTQYGGTGNLVLTEGGEFIKNPDGSIEEVDAPFHDNTEQVQLDGSVKKVKKGDGGKLQVAEAVLSDTTNPNKKRGTKSDKQEPFKFSFKKGENFLGLNINKTKSGSPSQVFKHLREIRDKEAKKFEDIKYHSTDPVSLETQEVNNNLLASLPSDEDIFDGLLELQELSKDVSGENFDETVKAQYGNSYGDDTPEMGVDENGMRYWKPITRLSKDRYQGDISDSRTIPILKSLPRRGDIQRELLTHTGLRSSQVNEAKNLYNSYHKSPLFKSRLKKMGVDENINVPPIDDVKIFGMDLDGQYRGVYNKDVYININDKYKSSVLNHEFSHNTDSILDKNRKEWIKNIPTTQKGLTPIMDDSWYPKQPREVRARVMELRGILDSSGRKSITEGNYSLEDIDYLKSTEVWKELNEVYEDEQIEVLLNELAINNRDSSSDVKHAQFGDNKIGKKSDSDKTYYWEKESTLFKPRRWKPHEPYVESNRLLGTNERINFAKEHYPGAKEGETYEGYVENYNQLSDQFKSLKGVHRQANRDRKLKSLEREDKMAISRNKEDISIQKQYLKDQLKKIKTVGDPIHQSNVREVLKEMDMSIKSYERGLNRQQYGGIPRNINGLYEETGPVIVPSNNITMSGIGEEVLAINPVTGELMEVMQPEQNYYFPEVEEVLEVPVPKAQGGGYWNKNRSLTVEEKRLMAKELQRDFPEIYSGINLSAINTVQDSNELARQLQSLLKGNSFSFGDFSIDSKDIKNKSTINSINNITEREFKAEKQRLKNIIRDGGLNLTDYEKRIDSAKNSKEVSSILQEVSELGRTEQYKAPEMLNEVTILPERSEGTFLDRALGRNENFNKRIDSLSNNIIENIKSKINNSIDYSINTNRDVVKAITVNPLREGINNINRFINYSDKTNEQAIDAIKDTRNLQAASTWGNMSRFPQNNKGITGQPNVQLLNNSPLNPNRSVTGNQSLDNFYQDAGVYNPNAFEDSNAEYARMAENKIGVTPVTPTNTGNASPSQSNRNSSKAPQTTTPTQQEVVESPLPRLEYDWVNPDEAELQTELARQNAALQEGLKNELSSEYMKSIQSAPKTLSERIRLGKLNRERGTNQISTAINQLARGISPEYMSDATNPRMLTPIEISPELYLDEIDGAVARGIQNVNVNTAQGQAIASNLSMNALRQKREALNRVNAQNQNIRTQTQNQNSQLATNAELRDDANRMNYFTRTQQSQAAYDANRMGLATQVDRLQNERTNMDNMFVLENMRNPNYKIEPDGTVYRERGPEWSFINKMIQENRENKETATKAKFGTRKFIKNRK